MCSKTNALGVKTNKMLASLLAIILLVLTSATTFADRDGDDYRGERNEHKSESRENEKSEHKSESRENEKNEHKNGGGEKHEDDRGERNEHKSESRENEKSEHKNGGGEKHEDDRGERNEHRYEKDYDNRDEEYRDQKMKQRKTEHKELRASYKMKFKAKLGNKLDNISKTKLETIVVIIDTKVLEIEADTTKTNAQKERLVTIYGAIRDLISDKISELSEGNILDELFK